MSADLITPEESVRLAELERRIESNVAMVGRDLFEIRESRLYRQTHGTFEEYCQARFGMDRRYINMQIKASEVIDNLGTNGSQNLPTSERQARPLTKLPAEQQPAAWEKAQEIAKEEGKPVTSRHVEAAVLEVMPKTEEPEPDTVVVDGTEPKTTRSPKWTPDDADRLWLLAKQDLNKILPTDKSRERVLNEIIAYAQARIESNK